MSKQNSKSASMDLHSSNLPYLGFIEVYAGRSSVRSSSQILLPRYLINVLSNRDEINSE